ncbi:MAG: DUF1365 domain-containing protein [Paracoccaceae bacterium]|nr:DUF1365 domain-containing protein [Paracoccaceae bacterium]
MTNRLEHIRGETTHARTGGIENAFRYGIDYVLLDAEAPLRAPRLFGRNRGAVIALDDRDHGGHPGAGRGPEWVRDVLAAHQIGHLAHRIELLAQPKVLGHIFNPVSFWLIRDEAGDLRAVIAEVTNTFGDRHSYLCRAPGNAPITPADIIEAEKIFHVSPFQPIAGGYVFRFNIAADRIAIRIELSGAESGVVATLTGDRRPATASSLLGAMLRRPFGSRRVLALIHWQALKLWWKGARYRARPDPPVEEVST